jgi:hypothetical protein
LQSLSLADLFEHSFGKIAVFSTDGNIQRAAFGVFAIKTSAS